MNGTQQWRTCWQLKFAKQFTDAKEHRAGSKIETASEIRNNCQEAYRTRSRDRSCLPSSYHDNVCPLLGSVCFSEDHSNTGDGWKTSTQMTYTASCLLAPSKAGDERWSTWFRHMSAEELYKDKNSGASKFQMLSSFHIIVKSPRDKVALLWGLLSAASYHCCGNNANVLANWGLSSVRVAFPVMTLESAEESFRWARHALACRRMKEEIVVVSCREAL